MIHDETWLELCVWPAPNSVMISKTRNGSREQLTDCITNERETRNNTQNVFETVLSKDVREF